MDEARPNIVHLVTAPLGTDARRKLQLVQTLRDVGTQHVYQLDVGPLAWPAATRVHMPLPLDGWRAFALRRALRRRQLQPPVRPLILHAWSTAVARWARPLATTRQPLLVEWSPDEDPFTATTWACDGGPSFVCSTERDREALVGRGAPATRCVTISPAAKMAPAGTRAALRAQLGLGPRDLAVVPVPPLTRSTGAFVAAWATLLLEKLRSEVRLVLPAAGAEADRVRRLVSACRHDWMLRVLTPDVPPESLLAAADVAVYLPPRAASVSGVLDALALRRPLVLSDIPAMRALARGAAQVQFCAPNDPRAATRAITVALAEKDADVGSAAPTRGAESAALSDMLGQYRAVYENLASRRPARLP